MTRASRVAWIATCGAATALGYLAGSNGRVDEGPPQSESQRTTRRHENPVPTGPMPTTPDSSSTEPLAPESSVLNEAQAWDPTVWDPSEATRATYDAVRMLGWPIEDVDCAVYPCVSVLMVAEGAEVDLDPPGAPVGLAVTLPRGEGTEAMVLMHKDPRDSDVEQFRHRYFSRMVPHLERLRESIVEGRDSGRAWPSSDPEE